MNTRRIVLVTLLCLLASAGLLAFARAAAPKTTLLVHAGAGIRPALDELGAAFQQKTGIRVDYNYKGSACLLPDVCVSKKGDAYLPGEEYFMKQAVDRGIVKGPYQVVATMTTVIVTQPGNPKKIKSLADLVKPGLRLGLGDPEVVAIGRAARETLVKGGVWEKAKKNIVMSAQNVSELSNAVKLKQVDAAIVWNATAAMYKKSELTTVTILSKHAVCSPVPVGLVTYSKHPKEAQTFINFLASPESAKIFVKHGFGAAPGIVCPPGRR